MIHLDAVCLVSHLLSLRNKYAHTFNALDADISFTLCTPPFLVEFPLVAGGVYSGGNPGADRVVYEYAIPIPPPVMIIVLIPSFSALLVISVVA